VPKRIRLLRFSFPDHDRWRASVDAVLANSLSATSRNLQDFRNLSYHIGIYTGAPGEAESDRQYFASQVRRAAALIDAAVFELQLLVPDEREIEHSREAPPTSIFVVHGHDDGPKYQLVRLLERTTSLEAIILHEQPNRGAIVIEKFERHADDAALAAILLTADDEGRAKRDSSAALNARARQNVVFEIPLLWVAGSTKGRRPVRIRD